MASANPTHEYKHDFYAYINAGSLSSASVVAPYLISWLGPQSLLDVGCGAGAWCRIWQKTGVADVLGVDGDYVDRSALLIPEQSFQGRDLSQPFSIGRKFDLVTSLEVAEHVPTAASATFVDNLVSHGQHVLFSAAVPGQGGEFHVNEQPLEFWRALFAARGYRCFDALRPVIAGNKRVEPWYRYNTLLYVADAAVEALSDAIRATEVSVGTPLVDRSPWGWRARNAVIRNTPGVVVDVLVRIKHEWSRRTRAGSAE